MSDRFPIKKEDGEGEVKVKTEPMECDEEDEDENSKVLNLNPSLPVAETLQEYFDDPNMFLPHPDFIKENYYVEVFYLLREIMRVS